MFEPTIPNKIELQKTAILLPYACNSRTHSDAQIQQIASSIKEFGFTNPILIDENNQIIAGHGRLSAAHLLKIKEVPCIRLAHLTEAQKKAYVIADNKLALNAGWDDAMLALELKDLESENFDLSLTGFNEDELAKLLVEAVEGQTDPDDVPEVQETAITVIGDIWTLGKHRLMCGDSTSIDAVDKLMKGQKADMIFTDPPYGISYSSDKFKGNKSGVTNKRNKAEMILGDGDEFDPSFIIELYKSAKEMFIWGYQYYPDKLGRGGIIVWNKKKESESKNPHGDFELCWSKKERNKMCWLQWGGFKNKEKNEDRLHTTQKPVALVLWFFENWGNGLNYIVDIFGGSGTTLIACEKTNRICFMMELDTKYCDVIIRRWQDFTGKNAVHSETGKTFNEMMNERSNNSPA